MVNVQKCFLVKNLNGQRIPTQMRKSVMKITINPEVTKEFIEEVKKAIKDNGGHCPCAIKKSKDTLCMCKIFRDMESGICPCGLYCKTVATEDEK